jgi:hypothetical protein
MSTCAPAVVKKKKKQQTTVNFLKLFSSLSIGPLIDLTNCSIGFDWFGCLRVSRGRKRPSLSLSGPAYSYAFKVLQHLNVLLGQRASEYRAGEQCCGLKQGSSLDRI